MVIIVKWQKTPPSSPIFSRKFVVAIVVLIIFVVYIANVGKMMSVDNEGAHITVITDGANAEKFRFVELNLVGIATKCIKNVKPREPSLLLDSVNEMGACAELKMNQKLPRAGFLLCGIITGISLKKNNPYPCTYFMQKHTIYLFVFI